MLKRYVIVSRLGGECETMKFHGWCSKCERGFEVDDDKVAFVDRCPYCGSPHIVVS